jgi:hypothetical protein
MDAVYLRIQGCGYSEIAAELGYNQHRLRTAPSSPLLSATHAKPLTCGYRSHWRNSGVCIGCVHCGIPRRFVCDPALPALDQSGDAPERHCAANQDRADLPDGTRPTDMFGRVDVVAILAQAHAVIDSVDRVFVNDSSGGLPRAPAYFRSH